MTRLIVNGVGLNVEVHGNGPAVLALHGFTGSTSTWAGLVQAAQDKYTLILVDLLGHGESDSPDDPERYLMERCIADLMGVLDYLKLQRACFLGYSMGARIALSAAAAATERCATLILEGGSPGLANHEERAQRIKSDSELASFVGEHGIELFVDRWEQVPLFASQAQLSPPVRRLLRSQRLQNNPKGLANSLRGIGTGMQPPLHHELPSLAMPVLCIAGELDSRYTAIAEEMCRALPDGHLAIIPRAGHNTHLEQPEFFNQVVLGFLDSLSPRGNSS
ncbi:MAG: 2-succinyl-6-hydroxy-2,4-cyclohexadiene-1-carboxylate synthase [Chloroflexi bacterium]|nr:2-succinyl-6-hydroxy-2,4-cyclohexadiene-1-carboxylate synthase [Chloroflexota bacterium]